MVYIGRTIYVCILGGNNALYFDNDRNNEV